MSAFIVVLQLVAIFGSQKFVTVKSEYNRKWLEIDKQLFIVEPHSNFTWKEAVAACKREHSSLINPRGDYDYAKLKDVIKRNFHNYSSFWTSTQVKWTSIFDQIGLGKEHHSRQKCHKFDNSSTFKFLPDNCDAQLGFICEKPLLKGYSSFNIKRMVYLVQPEAQYTCEQAYDQCEKRQMSLVVLKDHESNNLLRNYVFINYGSEVSFWFSYNNETHYNCATYMRGQQIRYNSKLGFICQRALLQSSGLNMRHTILLICVAVAALLTLIMFIIMKCLYSQKFNDSLPLSEACSSEEVKVTDII